MNKLKHRSDLIVNSMLLTSIKESATRSDYEATSSSGSRVDDDESPERGIKAVLDKVDKALKTTQTKPEELFEANASSFKRPIERFKTIIDHTKKEGMLVGARALKKLSSDELG